MHLQMMVQGLLLGGCRQCRLRLNDSRLLSIHPHSPSTVPLTSIVTASPLFTSAAITPGITFKTKAKTKLKTHWRQKETDAYSIPTANFNVAAHAYSHQTMKVYIDFISPPPTKKAKMRAYKFFILFFLLLFLLLLLLPSSCNDAMMQ